VDARLHATRCGRDLGDVEQARSPTTQTRHSKHSSCYSPFTSISRTAAFRSVQPTGQPPFHLAALHPGATADIAATCSRVNPSASLRLPRPCCEVLESFQPSRRRRGITLADYTGVDACWTLA
jgi:hypothetical protein